uniref:Uncharacterized protein n=1 Tax=Caenorhabditis japonica TaxID=281687 RepID=A0A8R1IHJ9_CAEJA
MGVCRRIYKHYQPSELTICVTIRCEPGSPPQFHPWSIEKPGCAPKFISASTPTRHMSKKDDVIEPKIEDVLSPTSNFKKFDLLSNDDVALELVRSNSKSSVVKRKKKKKLKTSDAPTRLREFTETTISMYIEMDKKNVGEFVWDQQCTRIDALVAPIVELDRTTTPEIPVDIQIFD